MTTTLPAPKPLSGSPVTATLTFNLSEMLTGQELSEMLSRADSEGVSLDALLIRMVRESVTNNARRAA